MNTSIENQNEKSRKNNLKSIASDILLGKPEETTKDKKIDEQESEGIVDNKTDPTNNIFEKREQNVNTESGENKAFGDERPSSSITDDSCMKEQEKIERCAENQASEDQKDNECLKKTTVEVSSIQNPEKDKQIEVKANDFGNAQVEIACNKPKVNQREQQFADIKKKEKSKSKKSDKRNAPYPRKDQQPTNTQKQKEMRQNRFENKSSEIKETDSDFSRDQNKEEFHFFWQKDSPFSQWHRSKFTVNGKTFGCAEQYMMYSKAALFDDWGIARKIMEETDPRKQKAMGREVRNFNQKKWDENCMEIVRRGNIAKFSQNPKLYEFMLSTYPKTLVEASPYDRIWGIGLTEYDEAAYDRKTWRGKNLLGQALTEVRDQLIEEGNSQCKVEREAEGRNDMEEQGNSLEEEPKESFQISETEHQNSSCSMRPSDKTNVTQTENINETRAVSDKNSLADRQNNVLSLRETQKIEDDLMDLLMTYKGGLEPLELFLKKCSNFPEKQQNLLNDITDKMIKLRRAYCKKSPTEEQRL